MGHFVHAIIAEKSVLPALASQIGTDFIVSLPQGFGLIPISERVVEDLHPGDEFTTEHRPEGFLQLSDRLIAMLVDASKTQPIAYIETDYHAGAGTQRSVLWIKGERTVRSMWHTDVVPQADRPINAALRALGVQVGKSIDEFDTIKLDKAREDEDWELLAHPNWRILHISTRLILGGSQENTVLSCEGQVRTGHEVHLAFGPIYGPEGSMLQRVQDFRVCKADTITTHTIPHLIRAINPIADLRCYFELKKLIRNLNPDIVHTHSSKAGILGRAAAWSVFKRSNQKHPTIIHTIHGPPFHKYQSKLKNLIYTLSERFAARRCHTIVSVADAMTSQYLARNIGTPAQYTTVRSGIETVPYHKAADPQNRTRVRRELNLDENDFVIGTVARLAELKGHDDLLDALADDLGANPNWKLLWVGNGWWKERLMKRVAELNLSGQVITTGLIPPEQVPDMIAAMDILVHPSYREGLPRTVAQALLTGVCPIANDVDGTREVCKDLETGRLVPAGDTQALGDAIRWAAAHPDEIKAMATRGKEICHADFSAETMVHDLGEVYAEAIERAR